MRKYLLGLVAIAAMAAVAVPTVSAKPVKSAKATGERCMERVQKSACLLYTSPSPRDS